MRDSVGGPGYVAPSYEGIELVCERGGLVSNEVLWGRSFKDVADMVKDCGLTV